MVQSLEILVEAGKATPGPPLGPALGPLGLNIGQVVKEINEKTKNYEGMQVPVKLTVDPKTKQYTITVGTPPVSALIKKELGIEKGSGSPKATKVGNLKLDQVKKIARMKIQDSLSPNIRAMVMEVLGSCVSMGVTVEGMDPKEVQKKIENGEIEIGD